MMVETKYPEVGREPCPRLVGSTQSYRFAATKTGAAPGASDDEGCERPTRKESRA